MDFLSRILDFLKPSPAGSDAGYMVYVRCHRCGEPIATRIDLRNDAAMDYDTNTRYVRKLIVGSGERRCFAQIEVELTFARSGNVTDRQIQGGKFLSEEEYQQELAAWESPDEATEEQVEEAETRREAEAKE